MVYQYEHGEHEEFLIKQALQANQPIPDFILNKPKLIQGLELYLSAFWELDTERSHSMGPTPIPFTSVLKYAEHFEFDEEQTEALLHHIRRMDSWRLGEVAKLQKAK